MAKSKKSGGLAGIAGKYAKWLFESMWDASAKKQGKGKSRAFQSMVVRGPTVMGGSHGKLY